MRASVIDAAASCGLVFDTVARLSGPSMGERRNLTALDADRIDHAQLFERLPALHSVEVRQATAPVTLSRDKVRIAFWNAERCKYLNASAALLGGVDLEAILLAEMDDGMARSGQHHTTRELADRLDAGYAFGVEFVELALGDARERAWHAGQDNEHGLHGGAIVSRLEMMRPALLRLETTGRWWSGALKGERRIGGRIAVAVTVRVDGCDVALVSTHLESHSDPDDRAEQVRVLLDGIERYAPGKPVVLAGDFNTATLGSDQDTRNAERKRLADEDPDRFLRPERFEPLFAVAESRGYDWLSCNEIGTATQRTRPDGTPRPPHGRIDWFFVRGIEASDPRTVGAVDADGTAISDHEILTVTIGPKR